MNPLITGRLRNPATKPSRNTPLRNRITPESSAIWPARTMLSPDPDGASVVSELPIISEVMAIGPTDCTMLLPNSA